MKAFALPVGFVLAVVLGFTILAIFANVNAPAQDAAVLSQDHRDIELLKQLTRYVDHNTVSVNREGLKKNFFPLLDLREKDKIVLAEFGFNASGRWFSMTIQKVSRSGKTTGLFELTFYSERHKSTDKGSLIFFDARGGFIYGEIPDDETGVVSAYDLGWGNYLVNDEAGRVVHSTSLPEGKHWSKNHTFGKLLNAGKTVGSALDEHLDTLERTGLAARITRTAPKTDTALLRSWTRILTRTD